MSGDGYQLTPEEQKTARLLRKVMHDESAGARITFKIGPASAFTLVGFLQLCLRQEQMLANPNLKATANTLCHQFAEPFRKTPLWPAIQAGYDHSRDVTQRIEEE